MPTCFTDSESRTWDLRIDVSAIRRVRAATGVDLGRVLADAHQLLAMQSDISQFVDVLFAIVEPVAKDRNVTAEMFGSALFGDVLGNAIDAFETAIVEFLPEPQRRAILKQMIEGTRAAQAQATLRLNNAMRDGLMEGAIAESMADLDQKIAAALERHRKPTGSGTGPT